MRRNRIRRCTRCGAEFDGRGEPRLCPECRAAVKATPTLIEHTCPTCGTVFIGGPRATYCPDCRRERQKESNRRSHERQKAGKARRIGSTSICERCGQPYIISCANQQYCPTCGPIALHEKILPLKREYAKRRIAEHPTEKADLRVNGTICVVCGNPFTATTATNTCSEACAKEYRRQRQHYYDQKRRPPKHKPE